MTKRQLWPDEEDWNVGPIEEYSLEELEKLEEERIRDRDAEGIIDTANTDGSTTNPQDAQEQGLVYEPPTDPPVIPSDSTQGIEIAAGFASSLEESDSARRELSAGAGNQDLNLGEDIQKALLYNSETCHLDDIDIAVVNGIVRLRGTVIGEDDIELVESLVRDMYGVVEVQNELEVAEF